MVMETSSMNKDEVQLLWVAPPVGHGCVKFRATVLEEEYGLHAVLALNIH